ncbi:MAG: DNA repair protein RecN [Ornithinimicrobium sp.]|uniref:DNA repair protein RecN n=1 Tax=Ornithinimicrobium sp. TaxID=1977084 RepID=UPI003D9ABD13
MLRSLRIRQLGVIEDAELVLSPGLNVITGETGAGKTMVVTALGLLLGARADPALVRAGARSAVAEAEVDVGEQHPASVRVRQAGGAVEDGLILARTVSAEGRSRAHVGGRAAPVSTLGGVGEHLVAVHGQADQWRLREVEQHRVLLDGFGGEAVRGPLTAYRSAYADWTAARRLLSDLTATSAGRAREVQMLRSALAEIEQVDPQPGEQEALQTEADRLAYAEGLRAAAYGAHAALAGDDETSGQQTASVVELLSGAVQGLGSVSAHDPELQALGSRLDELSYLAADLAADLASYGAAVESDPLRLEQVQQRRAALSALQRGYGGTTAEVLAWAQESARRLTDLDVSTERVAEVRDQVSTHRGELVQHGQALRSARVRAAQALGEQVTTELAHLAMGSARVHVDVQPRDIQGEPGQQGTEGDLVEVDGHPCRPRPHGLEDVVIRLAPSPGAPARPVTKAASGGELSRVMLALELVGARGTADVPTYVFDEVDAGVGGSAALDLGARLARLAQSAQVVVVTHLGQVAAFADRQLAVRKSSDGRVSASDVRLVDGPDRVAEIARMLGGVQDSEAALEHARELLAQHAPSRLGGSSGEPGMG